jgi:hypothetical protein
MDRTITEGELAGFQAFGREIEKRKAELRLKFDEIAELTRRPDRTPISKGYISDICRMGRGDLRRAFRITPDKIIRIAEAVGWNGEEALQVAQAGNASSGLSNEANQDLLYLLENAPKLHYRPNIEIINRVTAMAKRELETMLAEETKQRAAEDETQETNYPET